MCYTFLNIYIYVYQDILSYHIIYPKLDPRTTPVVQLNNGRRRSCLPIWWSLEAEDSQPWCCLLLHLLGYRIPSDYVKIANCKMAIEIVDFPIDSMVMFHSYVTHYQRVVCDKAIWGVGFIQYECRRYVCNLT